MIFKFRGPGRRCVITAWTNAASTSGVQITTSPSATALAKSACRMSCTFITRSMIASSWGGMTWQPVDQYTLTALSLGGLWLAVTMMPHEQCL